MTDPAAEIQRRRTFAIISHPNIKLYLLMNPQRIARHVLKNVAQLIAIGNVQLVIRSSIGIAIYPEHGTAGETLTSHADDAMYSQSAIY